MKAGTIHFQSQVFPFSSILIHVGLFDKRYDEDEMYHFLGLLLFKLVYYYQYKYTECLFSII